MEREIVCQNGCEFASQCGFAGYLANRDGFLGIIDCGKINSRVCARSPQNSNAWILLEYPGPRSDEEMKKAFPNGLR